MTSHDHYLDQEYHFQDLPLITKIEECCPIAAKPHRCMICDGLITTGERHHKLVYRQDDALDRRTALKSVRYHIKCPEPETCVGCGLPEHACSCAQFDTERK